MSSSDVRRLWIMGGGLPPFEFDCVVSETHTSTLKITDDPVETGVVVSDHAYKEPDRLSIEAWVGDVWLKMRAPAVPISDSSGHAVTVFTPPNADFAWLSAEQGDDTGRAARAFQSLKGLQASAEPFNVQTGLRLYQNMLVETISSTQDAMTGNVLSFRAELREIIQVSTLTITYPPRQPGKAARQASKPVTAGEQSATQVTDASKSKSILLSGVDLATAKKMDVSGTVDKLLNLVR